MDFPMRHGEILLTSWWRCCALLYSKTMDWLDLWAVYENIPTTWRDEESYRDLWGWYMYAFQDVEWRWFMELMMTWDCCNYWRLHIIVVLKDLMHWGARISGVLDFDAVWGAYLWAHLWGVFRRSDLMGMIEMRHFGVDGVVAVMMPLWKHLGMGWAET